MSSIQALAGVEPACTSYAWWHVGTPQKGIPPIARVTTRQGEILWEQPNKTPPYEEPPYSQFFIRTQYGYEVRTSPSI